MEKGNFIYLFIYFDLNFFYLKNLLLNLNKQTNKQTPPNI